jgi:hypothetical protein
LVAGPIAHDRRKYNRTGQWYKASWKPVSEHGQVADGDGPLFSVTWLKFKAPLHCSQFPAAYHRFAWLRTCETLSDRDRQADMEADVIVTDASEQVWGAIHIAPDGTIRVYAEAWTAHEKATLNLQSSVVPEPLAIRRALCRIVTPAQCKALHLYTDHAPLIDAVQSACARTYTYCQIAVLPAR